MNTKPIRSPAYPSMSLEDAVMAVGKIEAQYRGSPVDREDGAKLLGYSGSTGPANKALAALASFGLVERAGKGMMRVTGRARAILHPESESDKARNLKEAALEPKLFREIMERFDGVDLPPMEGVVTYLNREGFNPSAVGPAAKAFINTMNFVQSLGASESHGETQDDDAESESPDEETTFGGASVGDMIQWESQGVLQFEMPRRVRWVSPEGDWLAVEGSDTGIPMSQVTVERTATPTPPVIPPHTDTGIVEKGFSEWFRAKVGADKIVTINFKGEGDIGPKEIEKMIRVLEAQKLALED
ncbi:hypothetical protein K1T73_15915 [Roseovarius sp. SCSIO 43702]|uniref:hypothetical protein n=1 Tax=Roseovarius sp. SCSIO 43702 TaxID=2823043 RepID=UPI001C733702|nr:hypothetical protein [Roseovarius sp. SCSIO 43702]QYX56511.1 hypothetical protein K1T73_15915 [Roseovarius sp. SCSIO 43702]